MQQIKDMVIEKNGNTLILKRAQWKNREAYISDYPGLLEAVCKHTWSFSDSYLKSAYHNMSLHKFVLCYRYGETVINNIISEGKIIEHLDNNGLNCSYENLHIVSSRDNKMKAFSPIDARRANDSRIPLFTIDVFYSHNSLENGYYQVQIYLNDSCRWRYKGEFISGMLFLIYTDFQDLMTDWIYLIKRRVSGELDIQKLKPSRRFIHPGYRFIRTPEEIGRPIIEREGQLYFEPSLDSKNLACVIKTSYRSLAMK